MKTKLFPIVFDFTTTKKIMIYVVFLVLIIATTNIRSQNPPCLDNYPYITYNAPRLDAFPPYSTDMSYDVLLAYVALDSVSHYANRYEVSQFLERQTFNDTIQTIMRYYYQMKDYDPIKYTQSESYRRMSKIECTLSNIDSPLNKMIKELSPNSLLDYTLCRADYILEIKATNIDVVSDTTTSGPAKEVREIYCEVIDTIKGKRIPYFVSSPSMLTKDNRKDNITMGPMRTDTNFVFHYSPYWGSLTDDEGQPWIKEDSLYIVFLTTVFCCQDSSGIYYHLRPVWPESRTFGMYPILNGKVHDPGNDFGFGTGITASEFKRRLRERINQIISY